MTTRSPAVWFPAVRTGTGTDVFTERLAADLQARGIQADITWLPLRAEYAPWTVTMPSPPDWANVVHVNTWLHPRFLPTNLPVVATVHHSIHNPALDPYKGLARRLYHKYWIRKVERHTMQRADVVTAVSRFAAEMARQKVLDCPIEVIYNGVDTDKFCPPARRVPHHPFRLLYVGSWMARKGVDLLAPIMRELGDNFILNYTGGAVAECDKPGMPGNMYDIGRLRSSGSVVAAMQQADAFLFPSRSEGFGLVVIEAMACGLPVVATHGSSLVEIVDDGVTGVLCGENDVDSIVGATRGLAKDPIRYHEMSLSAVSQSSTKFTSDEMLDGYCRVYDEFGR